MTKGVDRSEAIGTVSLAAALAGLAFVGKGGTDVSRLADVEIWVLTAAAGVLAIAAVRGRVTSVAGLPAVIAFLALAALTALSISWSLAPDETWIEANRTLAYLFAFSAAVAAGSCMPAALRPVLGALTLAAVAVVGYGLAARVWPGTLAELEFYARVGQPFGYWNALGVTAAMGLMGAVWFGSRRALPAHLGALAAPAAAWLFIALLLTYSRSGLLAAAVAVGCWLVVVPLRLRSLTVLAAAATGAAPAIAWALSQPAFTEDGLELAVREKAGTTFGLLLLVATVTAYALCFAALRARERRAPSPATRVRAGRAAAAAVAFLLVIGLAAVATTTERGLGGTLSDRLEELTDDSAKTKGGPGRLGTTASSRSSYWRSAAHVFEDHPIAGAGAGSFAVTGLRYRESAHVSRHAHGYVVQTMADLGLAGLALTLLLAAAWLVAALRAVGALPRGRSPGWTEERVAVTALFLVAFAYGLQSAFDWTWFVPGPTLMALVAAGFVAGRPPPGGRPRPAGARLRPEWRLGLAALAVVAALAAGWSAWQPPRALERANAALGLAAAGDPDAALEKAEDAREINPLSPQPLWAKASALYAGGRPAEAHDALERAAVEHPNLPHAWLRLADFRLDRLNQPAEALEAVEVALYLDPQSAAVQQSFIDIRDRFRAAGQLPPETAPPPQAP